MENQSIFYFLKFSYKYSCFMQSVITQIITKLNDKFGNSDSFILGRSVYNSNYPNIVYGYYIKYKGSKENIDEIYIGLNTNFLKAENYYVPKDEVIECKKRENIVNNELENYNNIFFGVDILEKKCKNFKGKSIEVEWEKDSEEKWEYFSIGNEKELLKYGVDFRADFINLVVEIIHEHYAIDEGY